MNKITILILTILFCFGCNNKKEPNSRNSNFELNNDLLEKFEYDNRLYPENPEFSFIEYKTFNINDNQTKYKIILKRLEGWENDPGDFHQINIQIDNETVLSETHFDGWVKSNTNEYVTFTKFNGNDLIILTGYHFPSESAPIITIVEFNDSAPRLIFNKNMNLTKIENELITFNVEGKILKLGVENNKLELIDK